MPSHFRSLKNHIVYAHEIFKKLEKNHALLLKMNGLNTFIDSILCLKIIIAIYKINKLNFDVAFLNMLKSLVSLSILCTHTINY